MILTIGVILPHTRIFGGVKRFLEIGNLLVAKGHRFIVFTPDADFPEWFNFNGSTERLSALKTHRLDAIFTTEIEFLGELKRSLAKMKIFYAVLERPYIRRILREEGIVIFANSVKLFHYLNGDKNPRVVKAIGGIDLKKFAFKPRRREPGMPFTVMVYGRFYRRKKGTMMVVRACERLYRQAYNIRLHLFDSPVDESSRAKVRAFTCKVPFEFFVDYPVKEIADLYYKADVFVSAERNAGWCNTGAEAMACGVPLIATTSGTKDFLFHEKTGLVVYRHSWFIKRAMKRLYEDEALRTSFMLPARKKIEEFSWQNLADQIEQYLLQNKQNV